MKTKQLEPRTSYRDIIDISDSSIPWKVVIPSEYRHKIDQARRVIEKICREDKPVYGVNTGFGINANKKISQESLETLQYNLIRSHAIGLGEPLDKDISRGALFVLISSLIKGHSGVRLELIDFLITLLHSDVIPVIPSTGSLGASGDLAQLAHLALVITGEGEVWHHNGIFDCIHSTKKVLERLKIEPMNLEAKEGLALINGTHVMSAISCFNLHDAETLIDSADLISALSIEAIKGSLQPFSKELNDLKPYPGQIKSARNIRDLLKNSRIIKSHTDCAKVQDPYSFRCIPQVHGDCREVLIHATEAINVELNSVTDNPLIVDEKTISGGNFHGQRISSVMSYLAGSLINLGTISERRINNLLDGSQKHLPQFLTENPGLSSGLMILQYTAAAAVSKSQSLSPQPFVANIPVCANQEDYVSMGMTACQQTQSICPHIYDILAIELICAAQALEFIKESPSRKTQQIHNLVRQYVKPLKEDRSMAEEIKKISKIIKEGKLLEVLNA